MNGSTTEFWRSQIQPFLKGCFDSLTDRILLIVITLLGLLIRLYFVDQPMRVDESWTFLASVKDGWQSVLTYTTPNNHIFHSILVKISTQLFGESVIAIRLITLVFGTLSILLVFFAARCLGSNGLFAALVVALNPYLILFSTNARGYSLLVSLFLALIIVGNFFGKNPNRGGATAFAVISALGMLTIPTMVFPLSGLFLWLAYIGLGRDQSFKSYILGLYFNCVIKTIAFTAIFYSPIIYLSGIKPLISNEWVKPQLFHEFLKGIRWHFEDTYFHFVRDMTWGFVGLCIVLTIIGAYYLIAKKDYRIPSLIFCLVLSAMVLFFAQHRIPYERTWIYFIPVFALVADQGSTYLINKFNQAKFVFTLLGIFLVFFIPIKIISKNAISQYEDTGIFSDAPEVAKTLVQSMQAGDTVIATDPENLILFFYLWYYNSPSYGYGIGPGEGTTYYILPPSRELGQLLKKEESVELLQTINKTRIYRSK